MKRFLYFVLIVLLCFSVCSCGFDVEEAIEISEGTEDEFSTESSEASDESSDESSEEQSEPFFDVTLDMVNLFTPFESADMHDKANDFIGFILEYYGYENEPLYSIYLDIKQNGYSDDVWIKHTGNSIHVWRSLYLDEAKSADNLKIISLGEKGGNKKTVLTFGGDISLADNYATIPYLNHKKGDIDYCISPEFSSIMREADVAMLNLENALSDRGTPMKHKLYTYVGKPENAEILKKIGVDYVSLANNHVFDYGEDAFFDTLDTLDKYGIDHSGAGRNANEAQKPFYYVINGRKIAYISATRAEKNILTPEATDIQSGVFRCYDNIRLLEVIEETKQSCDYVILLIHWGTEYSAKLEGVQKDTAHEYIDAGADLIVGTHAHQLQGIEFYKGKAIFYNLGNFWFNAKDIETGLLKLELDGDGNEEFYFIPGLQSGCKTKYLLGTEQGREILDNLASHEPEQIEISDDGKISHNTAN
ncbi:MAG: CapA family protein [Clostridia bacterium]|nr:CapA family protein [Clostridia bacterium]